MEQRTGASLPQIPTVPVMTSSELVHTLATHVILEHQHSLFLMNLVLEDKARINRLSEQLLSLLPRQNVVPKVLEQEPVDPSAIRKAKILKYKEKVRKRRQQVRVTRECPGRKLAASARARIQGKFAKMA